MQFVGHCVDELALARTADLDALLMNSASFCTHGFLCLHVSYCLGMFCKFVCFRLVFCVLQAHRPCPFPTSTPPVSLASTHACCNPFGARFGFHVFALLCLLQHRRSPWRLAYFIAFLSMALRCCHSLHVFLCSSPPSC